jgi:hypothetical protein
LQITFLYGITQDPQTKNYLMILSDKCKKCNYTCNAFYFHQYFESWTSSNDDLDKFIQDTQLSAHSRYGILDALEWIPYDQFYNIKYIKNISIYKANWIGGKISYWDNDNQNWKRVNNMVVTLKSLNDPKDVTLEFVNRVSKINF